MTGANGFVGKSLCVELHRQGQTVRAVTRSANLQVENIETLSVCSIDGETDWTPALPGVNVVIHLAARVHVMKDTAIDALAEFRRVWLSFGGLVDLGSRKQQRDPKVPLVKHLA